MTVDIERENVPHQKAWPVIRGMLFHKYFLLRRAMTLGVRGLVIDRAAQTVFLIRHTYVPGWHLPGGGVELGETMEEALGRELEEEGNIVPTARPLLKSIHFNRVATRRDHVALFLVEAFSQTAPKQPDLEIAESGFFPLDALPTETTRATRRRIDEIVGGRPPDPYW